MRDEKGAVKIGKMEQTPKNGREQRERGKMSKGAGNIDPPNRASGICPVTIRWTTCGYVQRARNAKFPL